MAWVHGRNTFQENPRAGPCEETDRNLIKDRLVQLRCHFTWELITEDTEIPDLENRILEVIEFQYTNNDMGFYNLLAYVRHLKGQNDEALQSLKQAEDLIQRQSVKQPAQRSLVTWGNYAWVYYHMGRLADAKAYLNKVEHTCKKFGGSSCFRIESPEIDCEEGWALMNCGRKNYERAKVCFEKALKVEPENPEFNAGYAIIAYRQDYNNGNVVSLDSLRKALRLTPDDTCIKVLLALKLQDIGEVAEGERYIEEALSNEFCPAYVFWYASKFYERKGCVEKVLMLLLNALQTTPNSASLHYRIGLCYKQQMIQEKETNMRPRGRNGDNVHRLAQLAISEFQSTLNLKPTYAMAYVCLAEIYAEIGQFTKAKDNFQKALGMKNLDSHIQQKIHLRYRLFQEFDRKFENMAIIYSYFLFLIFLCICYRVYRASLCKSYL